MSEYKECPYCAEQILAKAVKCKHCQSMLEETPAARPAAPAPPAQPEKAAPPPPSQVRQAAPPPPSQVRQAAPPPPPQEEPAAPPPPQVRQAAPPPPSPGITQQNAAPGPVAGGNEAGSYPKAGMGKRIGAYLIDCVIGFIPIGILLAIVAPIMVAAIAADPYGEPPAIILVLTILINVVGWLWAVFYFLFRDGFGRGQSVGKKILKIMVVRLEDGRPCTKGNSFVRNLIASILGIIDIVVTLVHEKGHRLGDMVAKTQVIELPDYRQ